MKELAREGTRVRFECSVYVPEDEICFFVFGAHSVRAAARAAERAGLDPLRIVEAVSTAGAHDTRRRRRNADVKEEQ
jgi:UDP-N-acetylmuramyl pentapeptide synthase